MRSKLLLLAAAGLLLAFLPGSQADCANYVANCTTEADAATPTLDTSDQKCRNLALYKMCLEKESDCSDATTQVNEKKANLSDPMCLDDACTDNANCTGVNQSCMTDKCKCSAGFKMNEGVCDAKMLNDTCDAGTTGDCGANMTCTDSKCACNAGEGNNGMGVCAASCAPSYKGAVGSCTPKMPGDNCTTGQADTCPANMQCSSESKCACTSGLKDNGMGTCAANCSDGYGDDGTGKCATSCAKGYKGDIGSCMEKKVSDRCMANDNATCGMNQWCQGSANNATCMCQPAFKANSSMYCVAKVEGDPCTPGVDSTCGSNLSCSQQGNCTCETEECENKNSAQQLPLTLALHLLPLGLVLALSRWM